MVYIKSSVFTVAATVDLECPYFTLVAPAPQGVGMNVKKAGYHADGQQGRYFITDPRTHHRLFPPASKADNYNFVYNQAPNI